MAPPSGSLGEIVTYLIFTMWCHCWVVCRVHSYYAMFQVKVSGFPIVVSGFHIMASKFHIMFYSSHIMFRAQWKYQYYYLERSIMQVWPQYHSLEASVKQ